MFFLFVFLKQRGKGGMITPLLSLKCTQMMDGLLIPQYLVQLTFSILENCANTIVILGLDTLCNVYFVYTQYKVVQLYVVWCNKRGLSLGLKGQL